MISRITPQSATADRAKSARPDLRYTSKLERARKNDYTSVVAFCVYLIKGVQTTVSGTFSAFTGTPSQSLNGRRFIELRAAARGPHPPCQGSVLAADASRDGPWNVCLQSQRSESDRHEKAARGVRARYLRPAV